MACACACPHQPHRLSLALRIPLVSLCEHLSWSRLHFKSSCIIGLTNHFLPLGGPTTVSPKNACSCQGDTHDFLCGGGTFLGMPFLLIPLSVLRLTSTPVMVSNPASFSNSQILNAGLTRRWGVQFKPRVSRHLC